MRCSVPLVEPEKYWNQISIEHSAMNNHTEQKDGTMDDNKTAELAPAGKTDLVRAEDFMPLMSVAQAIDRKKQINEFISGVMTEGEDYGHMPGDNRKDKKKVLLKPGAEKLCSIFGLTPQYVKETIVEDWTGQDHDGEPLFYYEYRCQLYRGGRFIGEAIGSANSWEQKHRYRWLSKEQLQQLDLWPSDDQITAFPKRGGRRTLFEFTFAVDKQETTGQYGKPAEHWRMFRDAITAGTARKATKATKVGDRPGWEIDIDQTLYRIPNPDSADIVNTLQKMAQKRALVAAVLVATNCSDAFTQDLEDDGGHGTAPAVATAGVDDDAAASAEHPESNVPGPLRMLLEGMGTKKGYVTKAFEMMRRGLVEALPVNGEDEYQRILKRYEIQPGGENKIAALRAAVLEMFDVAELAFEQKRAQDGGFKATDDDLPDVMKERPDTEIQEQMTMESIGK